MKKRNLNLILIHHIAALNIMIFECINFVLPTFSQQRGQVARSQPPLSLIPADATIPSRALFAPVSGEEGFTFIKEAKIQVSGINPDISWKIHLCELLPVPLWPLTPEPFWWNGLGLDRQTSFHFSLLLTEVCNARGKQASNCQRPLSTDWCWTPG